MSGGAEINFMPREFVDHAIEQGKQIFSANGQAAAGELLWAALKRKLDHESPGYVD